MEAILRAALALLGVVLVAAFGIGVGELVFRLYYRNK